MLLLVYGSINLDIAFRAAHLPAAGETVLGGGYSMSPGGKGGNQAHAAQRYGVATAMVGAVGRDDAFAAPALVQLRAAGVDLQSIQRLDAPTGCAAIMVDARGENQIVVAPGANALLRADSVPDALLAQAGAVLLQQECDPLQNEALLLRARRHGCLTVLNNAPAEALSPASLQALDLLVVNEGELLRTAEGAGLDVRTPPPQLLRELATRFALRVVCTLGSRGVEACDADGTTTRLPALPVEVVDTTGAGDTFTGVLVAALLEARPLRDALARATVAAGLACTRPGAQLAQPSRAEIEATLSGWLARR